MDRNTLKINLVCYILNVSIQSYNAEIQFVMLRNLVILGLLVSQHVSANCNYSQEFSSIVECKYESFRVILSCEYNLPLVSITNPLGKDLGSENSRFRYFDFDESARAMNCEASSNQPFEQINTEVPYETVLLNSADHFDHSEFAALQAYSMTNVVPMAKTQKRISAWKYTEKLVDCFRDNTEIESKKHSGFQEPQSFFGPLTVYSGVILGSDIGNDKFMDSHKIKTPDYYWKLIHATGSNTYDAWLIANNVNADVSQLLRSRRSVEALTDVMNSQFAESPSIYTPVINLLKSDVQDKGAERLKLKLELNSTCNSRQG